MPVGKWRAPRATSGRGGEPLAFPRVARGHVVEVAGALVSTLASFERAPDAATLCLYWTFIRITPVQQTHGIAAPISIVAEYGHLSTWERW